MRRFENLIWWTMVATIGALLVATLAQCAEARVFRRGGGSNVSAGMVYTPTAESTDKLYVDGTMSLEDIAQERATAMARLGRMDHAIHRYADVRSYSSVGCAEGIGCGGGSDPRRVATCICGARVVADAFARSASGTIYRVRFFR